MAKARPSSIIEAREGEQQAGGDVALSLAALEAEDSSEAGGEGNGGVQVEGPEELLPGDAEEEEQQSGCEGGDVAQPPSCEDEEEPPAGTDRQCVDEDEGGVVGADRGEDGLVDEAAADLKVAVERRQEVLQAEGGAVVDDEAILGGDVGVVGQFVDREPLALGRENDQQRGDGHRQAQRDLHPSSDRHARSRRQSASRPSPLACSCHGCRERSVGIRSSTQAPGATSPRSTG